MTVRSRFTLDTNVLVYAVDRDAGEKHDSAKDLMGRAALKDCVLTVQALAEFFHITTRKKLLELDRASAFVRDWLEVFTLASAGESALIGATDAVGPSLACYRTRATRQVTQNGRPPIGE